jgi:hypothetical protein
MTSSARARSEGGNRLDLAETTVKQYVSVILAKPEARNRVKAAMLAVAGPVKWTPAGLNSGTSGRPSLYVWLSAPSTEHGERFTQRFRRHGLLGKVGR